MPVNLNETQFELLSSPLIELNALEVRIVDDFGDPVSDIEFNWSLIEYREDVLKINFEFIDVGSSSQPFDQKAFVVVTFWDTELYFKGVQGQEIPFG